MIDPRPTEAECGCSLYYPHWYREHIAPGIHGNKTVLAHARLSLMQTPGGYGHITLTTQQVFGLRDYLNREFPAESE